MDHNNYSTPDLRPIDPIRLPLPRRVIKWIRENPKKSIPLLTSIGVIIAFAIFVFWPKTVPTPPALSKPQPPPVYYSPLTGREVSEADSKRPVIAAVIENSPEARPQSGLKQAGVVFESVAEGGITRFLALYQEDKPALIGPVRSVRPQFASWVAAFDAGLAHVGGSAIPLKKLRSGKIKDFDQFSHSESYWRSNDRYAPHNTYTSHKRLTDLGRKKNYSKSVFTSWKRLKPTDKANASKDKEVSESNPDKQKTNSDKKAKNITVPISTGQFAVQFNWSEKNQYYTRSQGGQPHLDQEKGRISPQVVIVMQVPHDIIRDSNGYSYPEANSRGSAWIFQNGTVKKVRWSKAKDEEQIAFYGKNKEDISLSPGQTWISAIREDVKPTW